MYVLGLWGKAQTTWRITQTDPSPPCLPPPTLESHLEKVCFEAIHICSAHSALFLRILHILYAFLPPPPLLLGFIAAFFTFVPSLRKVWDVGRNKVHLGCAISQKKKCSWKLQRCCKKKKTQTNQKKQQTCIWTCSTLYNEVCVPHVFVFFFFFDCVPLGLRGRD